MASDTVIGSTQAFKATMVLQRYYSTRLGAGWARRRLANFKRAHLALVVVVGSLSFVRESIDEIALIFYS